MGTIRIEGDDDYDRKGAPYSVSINGLASRTLSVNPGDRIEEDGLYGSIGGGFDKYRFTGQVVGATLPDHATLFVDGEQVDPADLASPSASPTTQQQPQEATTPTDATPSGTGSTSAQELAQTTTIGGSAPDAIAWLVALGAIVAAVYKSKQ
ncbi:hypothetical protein ACOZ4F_15035 [Haloarcula marismortui]|uniref:hypothetical protein n=1 Tax=Haloarcula marismortui TaxID=2238 RepID=UPI003C73A55D